MPSKTTIACSGVVLLLALGIAAPAFSQSGAPASPPDGSVLPFPTAPSASVAAPRLQG